MFCKNSQTSYRIQQNMLIVNQTIATYDKQIMRSSNTLFITDLAVEVPITPELRAYDQFYFHQMLKKHIISEIESCHPEVGLRILKQMPDLQGQHYQSLLSKISMQKLRKILMHNDFLLYLCQSLRRVARLPSLSGEQSDRLAIAKLTEPYQRAIYLLSNIQESGWRLKQILEITSKKLVYDIVDQKDFIQTLAFRSNSRHEDGQLHRSAQYIVGDSFLQKLQEFAILIFILQKNTSIQWQIIQYYIDKLEKKGKAAQETNLQFQNEVVSKLIEAKLFNKQCLNFIAKHFDHFFQYNRRDLLQVLVLILTHNKHQFWEELICYKDCPTQQLQSNQLMQVYPNNQNTLREFMINNYLNKDSHSWSQSLSILEKLNQIKEAETMLTDFYSDLVQYPMKVNVVELITAFIKITAEQKKKLQIEFKFLLSSFVEAISSSIDQMCADYFNQAKKIQTGNKYILRLIGVPMYPKIKTALLCAYIRAFSLVFSLNLCDHLCNFTFQKSIARILKMQFSKNSLIHGAKVQFIRHLKKNASNIKNCDIIEYLSTVS